MRTSSGVSCGLALLAGVAAAAPPPGPTWTNGNKQGIGTSIGIGSPVWFTLGEGVVTEIYYPTVDRANVRSIELLFGGGPQLERESAAASRRVEPEADALAFRQVNEGPAWRVARHVYTDPERPVVLLDLEIELREPRQVQVLLDPALRNGAGGDRPGGGLSAQEGDTALALASSCATGPARATQAGPRAALDAAPALAAGEDLVLQAALRVPPTGTSHCRLALGFGANPKQALAAARASLRRPAGEALAAYRAGWRRWLAALTPYDGPHAALYRTSLMVLRALEDKHHPGAGIASLTKPWGDSADASKADVGGYHLVWSRDLYHVATALDAAGDRAGAQRALDYLFRVQQRPDGSYPQNSWLDGRPFWPSLQLDEVAWPLLLALQLGRDDATTWTRHVRPSGELLLAQGPSTPQERWEEESGHSPSTIAAQIAGLVAAAEIAMKHGATADATRYRKAAREWSSRLPEWTVTSSGPHSPRPYYIRIAQRGRPDAGDRLELNNGGGSVDERSVVDAGFLELVRLGIRPADDPLIVESLRVVDRLLRVETPRGPGFYRYNGDGYGEKADGRGWDGTGVGRLWPLLTGERGAYELAAGRDARPWLDALAAFANEGRLLPEQIWDRRQSPLPHLRFGQGTGGATPLAWTHAQFVRLALSLQRGRLVEQPEAVRRFFATR